VTIRDLLAVVITAPVAALGLVLLMIAWAAWGGDLPA
jgi:hypothetical protein